MTEEQTKRMNELKNNLNMCIQEINTKHKASVDSTDFKTTSLKDKLEIINNVQNTYNDLFQTIRDINILNEEIKNDVDK